MREQIAKEIFCRAVDQAPHAEWRVMWWEDMTDEEKQPFLKTADLIIQKLKGKPMFSVGDAAP